MDYYGSCRACASRARSRSSSRSRRIPSWGVWQGAELASVQDGLLADGEDARGLGHGEPVMVGVRGARCPISDTCTLPALLPLCSSRLTVVDFPRRATEVASAPLRGRRSRSISPSAAPRAAYVSRGRADRRCPWRAAMTADGQTRMPCASSRALLVSLVGPLTVRLRPI